MADDTSSDPELAGQNPAKGPATTSLANTGPANTGPAETGRADTDPAGEVRLPDLRQLISDHYRNVYRYAYRLCGREADAEDLTQQTFLLAHRKLHQLREPDKADRWLYAVLRSCFLKAIGRAKPLSFEGLEMSVEDVRQSMDQDEIDREALQFALNDLTEEYRIVVLMFYFEELSYKEIADRLEIPIGTVMSRLARAKGQLRQRLFSKAAESREKNPNPPPRARVR